MRRMKLLLAGASALFLAGIASDGVRAQEVKRFGDPAGHFPISTAVEVPAGASVVYLSGMGAPPLDPTSKEHTLAAYGDMATQTTNALKKIQYELEKLGLSMGSVVQMHVYMVADATTHKLDFAGMMKGYTKFFGTKEQPNLPVRSAFAVAQLANPGWLIEIEVTAVRPAGK
ncbi:RidA family protein [Acidomonas methanolica]|uniref:RidA family protein n=1 Tax=Acidomonas methanolica TaxID=437 RepID=UPI00351CCB5A|nr:RidA family protein [Acidomonas methanolica]